MSTKDSAKIEKKQSPKAAEPELKQKVSELEQKCEEYLAGWKRAQADYQNLQKQAAKEKSETVKFANAQLLQEFLKVYDNFKMAVLHIPQEQEAEDWVIGIRHILKQMKDILEAAGVTEILTVGEPFNPQVHEAVEEIVTDKEHDGLVAEELRPGYTFDGKVIQVARVKVGKYKKE